MLLKWKRYGMEMPHQKQNANGMGTFLSATSSTHMSHLLIIYRLGRTK